MSKSKGFGPSPLFDEAKRLRAENAHLQEQQELLVEMMEEH